MKRRRIVWRVPSPDYQLIADSEPASASEPRSLGGEAPISRRCWQRDHDSCRGLWTQYPDQSGPCECECHR